MAAQIMRHILIPAAPAPGAQKRLDPSPTVQLEETAVLCAAPDPSVLAMDDALTASQFTPWQAQSPPAGQGCRVALSDGLTEEKIS